VGNAVLTAQIKADILAELGADDVNVDTSHGVVTLRGNIPYADFRNAGADIARRRGARQVVDELSVDASVPAMHDTYLEGFPGVTTPEGAPSVGMPLEQVVREALEDDPRVNAYVLTVRVIDGIAYLEGRQETVQSSEAATEVAEHVSGILSVSNDIEIMPSV
jgi:osmotically-inducible protein OsmY